MRGTVLFRLLVIVTFSITLLSMRASATDLKGSDLLGCWRKGERPDSYIQLCFYPNGQLVKIIQAPTEGWADDYQYEFSDMALKLRGKNWLKQAPWKKCRLQLELKYNLLTLECGPGWPDLSGSFNKRFSF